MSIEAKTAHLPECVVCYAGIEIPARYEIADGGIYLQAVKLNGYWADPAVGFRDTQISEWESDIADVEASIAAEAA